MARSRGGGGRARAPMRPMSPPPKRDHHSSPPPPAARPGAPPPAPSGGGGGFLSGLGGMVAQGMALGTGSALAHRAVDGVLGSRHPEPAQAQAVAEQLAREPEDPCSKMAKSFADCMSDNSGDLEGCRYYFDKLQACKKPEMAQPELSWQ